MKIYELSDIFDKLIVVLNKPIVSELRDLSSETISVLNPVAGVITNMANKLVTGWNTFKLNQLLKGLSYQSNTEMRINELYNYICLCDDNAISVANLLTKTVNAESPKSCLIYGLILADHLGDNRSFSQDELIVCKAIENATDYDLMRFKTIMESFIVESGNRTKVVIPARTDERKEIMATCDWCVYNRLFTVEYAEIVNGALKIDRVCYVSSPADTLYKYLTTLKRACDYDTK